MQTISTTALDILKSGHLVGITIDVAGIEDTLTLTQADIIRDSLSLDRNWVSGSNIEIGNVEISELVFSLDNHDRRFDSFRFEGAVLTVDKVVGAETLRLGKFIVDEIPRKKSILTIRALDYMAKFDQYISSAEIGGVTLAVLLAQACTACGVTLYTSSFTNSTYVCATVGNEDGDLTWRKVVAWIAELAGCNAWIDHNGELRLTWYGESQGTTVIPITANERRRDGYQMDENSITITGVVYLGDDTEEVAGTETYALAIEGNDLLDPDDAATVIAAIYAKVGGFEYTPFAFTTCCLPHVWPGDKLTITDAAGLTVYSYVMKHRFAMNGLSAMAAVGESVQRSGWASAGVFTKKQQRVIQKIASETTPDLSPYLQAAIQLNEVIANSHGFYTTVIDDPENEGARIVYTHDKSLLEESSTVYKKTIDAFAWTDEYTGDDETTVWESGYTAAGNMVMKNIAAIGLTAEWIITGVLADADGYTNINLDDGSFSFADGDLTYSVGNGLAAQYLTIHPADSTEEITLTVEGRAKFDDTTYHYAYAIPVAAESGAKPYLGDADHHWGAIYADKIISDSFGGLYVQDDEPEDAEEKSLWIDTNDYSRYDVQSVTEDSSLVLGSAEVVLGSGSGTDITLPDATQPGMMFKVFNVDGSNSITVQYAGMTTKTLSAGQSCEFISTGSTWVY
jgi:hypothetical protein